MDYSVSEILTLISHIHTLSADFTVLGLPENFQFVSSHGYILYLLAQNEENGEKKLTLGELSKKINRNKSTTTALIKKLENSGLVCVEPNQNDGRSKLIFLTEEGKKLNKITSEISKKLLETAYKNFSDEEKNTLLSLLLKLNGNIEDSLEGDCGC